MHKKDEDNFSIGLFSYQGSTGVTHMALALAAYFSSKKGRRVWFIEVGNQHTIETLAGQIKVRRIGEEGEFLADRVTFFPNVTIERAMELLHLARGIVIVDIGVWDKEKGPLLGMCSRRWLLGDFSLWKQEAIVQMLLWKIGTKKRHWDKCMCFFGKKHTRKISSKIGEKVECLPEIADPLLLGREGAEAIEKFLETREGKIYHKNIRGLIK